ncbi:DUF4160 domain-containing protein [Adhaeribacter arboris]|uniref:DUF4160 domain-containing protein n=1 Tax=Adhaeribacter arboris TaxID=2072846 RepID=A0A2T2Y8X1_9BACT|nr:DUF4160 domain-containing protein [Adhaeribacter arboris]PSR51957.1 DUF4160 domain-containing protein [Adhaeribacter arboris]
MPELIRFEGITIDIYYDEHLPPHFHATYGERVELIVIRTLGTYRGSIPPQQRKKVIKWAKQEGIQTMLEEIFFEFNPELK